MPQSDDARTRRFQGEDQDAPGFFCAALRRLRFARNASAQARLLLGGRAGAGIAPVSAFVFRAHAHEPMTRSANGVKPGLGARAAMR